MAKAPKEEIEMEIRKGESGVLAPLSDMLNTIKMRLIMIVMNRPKDD